MTLPSPAPEGGEEKGTGDFAARMCRKIPEPLVFIPHPVRGGGRGGRSEQFRSTHSHGVGG
jgi:hypothetical protein